MPPILPRPGIRPLVVAGMVLLAALVGVTAQFVLGGSSGAAQEPLPEPAFITLLNLTGRLQIVDVDQDFGDTTTPIDRLVVQPEEPATFLVDVGVEPESFIVDCGGCHRVAFSLAVGQRILIPLLSTSDPSAYRSDLHVVNETNGRQRGAVRIGSDPARGRSLLPFDLGPGESAQVGLRLPRGPLDLTLTCDNCAPRRIRIANAVDLEVAIK